MNARKLRTGTLTLSTLGAVWLAASSCSVLYDLNTNQCNAPEDCVHKGSAFLNSTCVNHVCVATSSSNSGGAPSTGGQSSAGGDITAGGTDTGGVGGGTSSSTGGAPSCTNAKCTADNNGAPAICRDGTCVPLQTSECPVLIPKDSANDLVTNNDGVIILGGFATMSNSSDYHDTQAVINWDLAFNEFNTYASISQNGLPSYSNSGPRPFVGLICNGYQPTSDKINAGMQQLSTVGVPAILSTLPANYLYQAWEYSNNPDPDAGAAPADIFFMNTGSANLQLVNGIQNNGLMWHMLGDPGTLAATTVALLKQMEPYVNAQRLASGDDPTASPMRVTLVYSDDPSMLDVASLLSAAAVDATHPAGTILTFNNKLALNNGAAFRQVKIDSANQHTPPNVTAATTDIRNYPPHVIVAMATYEFPQTVVPSIENTWPSGQMRPFYLMSHRIWNTSYLQTQVQTFSTMTPPLSARTVGVNFAQSQESRAQAIYASYLSRLTGGYQGTLSLSSTENYYDGAYYLLYAISAAAAARTRPSAAEISAGLTSRIISSSGNAASVDVGPGAIQGGSAGIGTIQQLFQNLTGYKMSLYGCDGPPNFDTLTGVRSSPTSAWCILSNKQYQPDGLIFDPTTKTFSTVAAGVPSCLQSYCPTQADAGVVSCPQNY